MVDPGGRGSVDACLLRRFLRRRRLRDGARVRVDRASAVPAPPDADHRSGAAGDDRAHVAVRNRLLVPVGGRGEAPATGDRGRRPTAAAPTGRQDAAARGNDVARGPATEGSSASGFEPASGNAHQTTQRQVTNCKLRKRI